MPKQLISIRTVIQLFLHRSCCQSGREELGRVHDWVGVLWKSLRRAGPRFAGALALWSCIGAANASVYAYIANTTSNDVAVIDTATNTVVATIGVGAFPYGVAVSPGSLKVYVTNISDATVSVIDATTNTVVATIGVGLDPYGVAVSPDGTRAYVATLVTPQFP